MKKRLLLWLLLTPLIGRPLPMKAESVPLRQIKETVLLEGDDISEIVEPIDGTVFLNSVTKFMYRYENEVWSYCGAVDGRTTVTWYLGPVSDLNVYHPGVGSLFLDVETGNVYCYDSSFWKFATNIKSGLNEPLSDKGSWSVRTAVPTVGSPEDMLLLAETFDVYMYVNDVWKLIGNVKGSSAPTGDATYTGLGTNKTHRSLEIAAIALAATIVAATLLSVTVPHLVKALKKKRA